MPGNANGLAAAILRPARAHRTLVARDRRPSSTSSYICSTLPSTGRHYSSPASSSSSSSSPSASSTNVQTSPRTTTPTAPQLPARRRPTFAAVGFGNGGSHPDAARGRKRAETSGSGGGGQGSARPPGRDVNSTGSRLRASLSVGRGTVLGPIVGTGAGASPSPSAGSGSTLTHKSSEASSHLCAPTDALPRPIASVSPSGLQAVARGDETVRMTQEDEVKVDGNEAEACYVPPPATLYYHHPDPLPLLYSSSPLPHFDIAYETWGTLNADRSNAILLHTGLSASSHVASGGNDVAEETRSKKGWWEDFVGPGKSIDTDKFFVVCTNVVGGCFGSTGPSSQWPHGEEGERLYASIGASMGGMQSLAIAYLAPHRVGRLASISAAGRSGLNGVGMRYAQRSVLMNDPNWNRGFYYDGVPPHTGMKLARQIATITYRSGPEWEERFGRRMLSEREDGESGKKTIGVPSLSPDFLIETYLDHQGERFCLTYDANTMIYLSKAMDLFDMTDDILVALADKFAAAYPDDRLPFPHPNDLPVSTGSDTSNNTEKSKFIPTSRSPHLQSLANGLKRLRRIPSLVLGVQSDVLFPVEQQRELADALKLAGNQRVTYYEIGGVWGHDTFLLDVQGVGGAIRGFLQWAD